jgi:hypothetical protein
LSDKLIRELAQMSNEIPFTILFALRRLEQPELVEAFKDSELNDKQKLRAVSALTTSIPAELLTSLDNDYLHFVASLERASEKLKANAEQENLSLILLADLRAKIEADGLELFTVNG